MGLFKSSLPICPSPRQQHCSQWARKHMKYCLCSLKDGVSLGLGMISVVSWGVAEVPQIVTNYKEKTTEGLSVAFLMTWILGDLFNLIGCKLEPATLPTQFYIALLYTVTTLILASQTIYYDYIYPKLKPDRWSSKADITTQTAVAAKTKENNDDTVGKQANDVGRWRNGFTASEQTLSSSPIPVAVPTRCHDGPSTPSGRELYYTSARSLSSSHTPIMGSFMAQRAPPISVDNSNSIEEPLLGGLISTHSPPSTETKSMLCVASAMTLFLGSFIIHSSLYSRADMVLEKPNRGVVIQIGRKLLQVTGGLLVEKDSKGSTGIGMFLGWAMAAIYMGGRLPQIFLNIKRGNVEGLNPLMFIFAVVGNATYVASILVSSLDWSKIRPNLPWLVDAGGYLFNFSIFTIGCPERKRTSVKYVLLLRRCQNGISLKLKFDGEAVVYESQLNEPLQLQLPFSELHTKSSQLSFSMVLKKKEKKKNRKNKNKKKLSVLPLSSFRWPHCDLLL